MQVMIEGVAKEIVGFAHPDIIFELGTTRLHGFSDCTFSVVPKVFKQLLIIMLYFSKYDLYVPVYFILLQVSLKHFYYYNFFHIKITSYQGKTREEYAWALSAVVRDSGLNLISCMCDYEIGLMKALTDEFGNDGGIISGCNFHFKQANRRQLLQMRVPRELVTQLIGEKGLMNFLEVINYEEIDSAIAYIRSKVDESGYKNVFDLYWSYFRKTLLRKTSRYDDKSGLFLFSSWNISHLIDKHGELISEENGIDVLVNRTNNPLERFNRTLNERIPTHPTMQSLVQILKEISCEYVAKMDLIKRRKVGRQIEHAPVRIPLIPADFVRMQT
jgi:hypothetical protein